MDAMNSPELQAAFTAELASANRKLRALVDERARDMGLTLSRARLLMQLAKADGPIQSDLAGLLDIEQPTLVRLLDGLERTGMIERRAVKGDRRARRVFLTEAARAQAEDILAFLTDLRADVLDGIDREELEIALRVLSRMSRNIVANRGAAG
ncbi:Transcriptional regulator, MarR family [Bosea sp. 62]|uniref:MarR family winged helix-turn-helix transcriptional regulator n=1 Tax=unclassified Bosea (in: a-proteobacteria) TaxID=2653178 RepID=UPI0012590411|nr:MULTISPECIES: MarR family transcriptional regulator [unclassified Bosea (in: a-proteobacteria)]CAD5292401.1 Transcriptional regulator, MarR family [Bosea sp. 7B]CAD5299127.1 Transcriptional regulator, MarR family [Bosea sp. 21B]CAD5299271.1 Transcriptional regulator, MarR family [Bosea sp. 46]VVT61611.1 Transcriptional regulator, MarR family [Bosea sp. EC-HK365B]VXB08315.1 Transcriptional regulator, MarR family [Bosea sp. 127]